MSTQLQLDDQTELLRTVIKNQYHAALAMLRGAIEQCPDDLWVDKTPTNPFWRIAYHALYFAHLYAMPSVHEFRAWEHHQTGIHDLDDIPAPPEIEDLCELPHRPPQTGEPYTKEQMLEYWRYCDEMVDATLDRADLQSADCGFSWYTVSKIEHLMVSIRHIQHHGAQLGDRVRNHANTGVRWVGSGRFPKPS